MSNRFDSQQYLDDYVQKGTFPKIHDKIAAVIAARCPKVPAMDFGACIGMLTTRLVEQLDMPSAVGIEPDRKNLGRALTRPNVKFYNMPIDQKHLMQLERIITENGVRLLVARRVISEIGFNNFAFMPVLSESLQRCGIEDIVLEGRVYSARSTHPIPNADKEAELMSNHFRVVHAEGDVRHMVSNKKLVRN